jgi:hypothetical protein
VGQLCFGKWSKKTERFQREAIHPEVKVLALFFRRAVFGYKKFWQFDLINSELHARIAGCFSSVLR